MRRTASFNNIITLRGQRGALRFFAAIWLWLEAVLRWCAPVFVLLLIVANLAFWGLLAALPPFAQILFALILWCAIPILLTREFRHIAWPNAARVKARLEQAGSLLHQPLQTLADEPMRRSPLADALWQRHKLQAAELLAQLRWPKLRAGYAPRDPFALRWLLMLLALLGAMHAPRLAMPRLAAAFAPGHSYALSALGLGKVYLYFVPPAHSGMAPVYLSSSGVLPKKLILPQGTMMWARVAGGAVKPVLRMPDEDKKFSRLENNFFVLQARLDSGDTLQIRQGFVPLLNLPIEIQTDLPPAVTLDHITLMPQGEMQMTLCAGDQYQLRAAALHWRGVDYPDVQGSRDVQTAGKNICREMILNFASDVLAGQSVQFWATAVNSAGLERQSEIKTLPLPHFKFQNPLAENLAAARQDYALRGTTEKLEQALTDLRRAPLPVGLFLAAQNVRAQLASHDADLRPAILANLWQITMRIEEGEYADIAANWRLARDELSAALPNWQVSESNLLKLAARASAAWDDDAPTRGEDPDAYRKVWQNIALSINSGNRDRVETLLMQLDQYPQALLAQTNTASQNEDADVDASATALRALRARLDNPALDEDERNYLQRLLVE